MNAETYHTCALDQPTVPVLMPPDPSNLQKSIRALDQEVHRITLDREAEIVGDKNTDRTYRNHLRRYEQWWMQDQALQSEDAEKENTFWTPVPAQPITATKVALFMAYKLKRPRVGSNSSIFINNF